MTQSRSRIPPLLEPYVHVPADGSLQLITGTLTAAPHWLTIRFLASLLSTTTETDETTGVVLASWMRDEIFWLTEARRGAGLDLRRLEAEGRWRFVDGVSGLFLPTAAGTGTVPAPSGTRPQTEARGVPARTPAPARGGPLPVRQAVVRGPVVARGQASTSQQTPNSQQGTTQTASEYVLDSPALDAMLATISKAVSSMSCSKTVLVLDAPTLLLATGSNPALLSQMVLQLRSLVHATIVVVEADTPLMAAATGEDTHTPLETGHAAFVAGLGHAAEWILSTRGLDTGVARDVSGVLTARRGGAWEDGHEGKELEVLFRVGGDGSVKVFERGTGEA